MPGWRERARRASRGAPASVASQVVGIGGVPVTRSPAPDRRDSPRRQRRRDHARVGAQTEVVVPARSSRSPGFVMQATREPRARHGGRASISQPVEELGHATIPRSAQRRPSPVGSPPWRACRGAGLGSQPVSAVVVADPDEVREARAPGGRCGRRRQRVIARATARRAPSGLMAPVGWRLPGPGCVGADLRGGRHRAHCSLVVQRLGSPVEPVDSRGQRWPSPAELCRGPWSTSAGRCARAIGLGRYCRCHRDGGVDDVDLWCQPDTPGAGLKASARGVLHQPPTRGVAGARQQQRCSVAALARAMGMPAPVPSSGRSPGSVPVDRDHSDRAITPMGRRSRRASGVLSRKFDCGSSRLDHQLGHSHSVKVGGRHRSGHSPESSR